VPVWSVDDFSRPRTWEGHTDWVSCVAFNSAETLLASGGNDRTIRLWDVASGGTLRTLRDHKKLVTSVSFTPDGRRLASASLDKTVKLWDVASGRPLAPVLTHPHVVHAAEREAIAWHRRQADECQAAEPAEWYGVAFHMSRLLEAGPEDWCLRSRRAKAKVALGQWQQAVDDCTRIIGVGATKPWPWYEQAVGRLLLGDTAALSPERD